MSDRKKIRDKTRKMRIIAYIMVVFLLYMMIYLMPNVKEGLSKTSIVKYGDIKVSNHLSGIVVRNESVVHSDAEGVIKYYISEGERVKRYTKILELQKNAIAIEVRKKLELINDKINQIDENGNLFIDDQEVIDRKIGELLVDIQVAVEQDSLLELKNFKKQINTLLIKKKILIDDENFLNKSIEDLENEKNTIQNTINKAVINYSANEAGIISFQIDGYEELLNPSTMYLLNDDKLDSINAMTESIELTDTINNQSLYKLIEGSTYYIVSWIDDDLLKYYEKGKTVSLKINDDIKYVKGSIYDVVKEDGSISKVIFKINRYNTDLLNARKVDLEVLVVDFEGLKINNNGIIVQNDQMGVFEINANRNYVFKPIKVLGHNEEYSIVANNFYYAKKDDEIIRVNTINLFDEIASDADKIDISD